MPLNRTSTLKRVTLQQLSGLKRTSLTILSRDAEVPVAQFFNFQGGASEVIILPLSVLKTVDVGTLAGIDIDALEIQAKKRSIPIDSNIDVTGISYGNVLKRIIGNIDSSVYVNGIQANVLKKAGFEGPISAILGLDIDAATALIVTGADIEVQSSNLVPTKKSTYTGAITNSLGLDIDLSVSALFGESSILAEVPTLIVTKRADYQGTELNSLGLDLNQVIKRVSYGGSIVEVLPDISYSPFLNNQLLKNLVSYWKLDEVSGTRFDSHGTNNLSDTNTVSSAGGILNNAADFDPSEAESLQIADNPSLSITGELTINAWIRLESTPTSNAGVVSKYIGAGDNRSYLFYVGPNRRVNLALLEDGGFSGASIFVEAPTQLALNTWYMVSAVYRPSTSIIIYINGTQDTISTTSILPSIYDGVAEFSIGNTFDLSSTASVFNGQIDEVSIWNSALIASKFTDLYNGGSALPYESFDNGLVIIDEFENPIINVTADNFVPTKKASYPIIQSNVDGVSYGNIVKKDDLGGSLVDVQGVSFPNIIKGASLGSGLIESNALVFGNFLKRASYGGYNLEVIGADLSYTPVGGGNGLVVQDTFTATDGTLLSGHTPDLAPLGSTYRDEIIFGSSTPSPQIEGNKARGDIIGFGNSCEFITVIDSGISDCTIIAKINRNNIRVDNGGPGVAWRCSATERNLLDLKSGGVRINTESGNVFVNGPYSNQNQDYVVKVAMLGEDVEIYIDDTLVHSYTDTQTVTNTEHGLGFIFRSGDFSTADDFTVDPTVVLSNRLLNNLVSYYTLDEASGTRFDSHGTSDLTEAGFVASATGLINDGGSFTSSNGVLSMSNPTVYGTSALSFSCWVRNTGGGGFLAISGANTISGSVYDWSVETNTLFGRFQGGFVNYGNIPNDGSFYHIVVTRPANATVDDLKCYINGVLQTPSTGAGSLALNNNGNTNWVGRSILRGEFDGVMDELAIAQTEWSQTDVNNLYNSGAGLPLSSFTP